MDCSVKGAPAPWLGSYAGWLSVATVGVLDGKGFICSLSRDVSPESPDLCLLAVIGGLKLAV